MRVRLIGKQFWGRGLVVDGSFLTDSLRRFYARLVGGVSERECAGRANRRSGRGEPADRSECGIAESAGRLRCPDSHRASGSANHDERTAECDRRAEYRDAGSAFANFGSAFANHRAAHGDAGAGDRDASTR